MCCALRMLWSQHTCRLQNCRNLPLGHLMVFNTVCRLKALHLLRCWKCILICVGSSPSAARLLPPSTAGPAAAGLRALDKTPELRSRHAAERNATSPRPT